MAELLYHVDEHDRVLGSVDRARVHQEGILHRSGMVLLRNSAGRMYITFRANKPTFPHVHDAASTFHVAYGESYAEAAARESKEELGLYLRPKFLGTFIHHDPPEHQIVGVFLAETTEEPRLDPQEARDGRWISESEVQAIIKTGKVTPWLRDGFALLLRTERAHGH